MKFRFYTLIIFCLYVGFSHGASFNNNVPIMSYKEKMLINGPYGENIRTIITKGDSVFILKADSIGFEKKKILFMKTGLIKKMIARNVEIEIKKRDKTLFLLKSTKAAFGENLKKLVIEKPQILFPGDLKTPTRIIIEINKRLLLINKKRAKSIDL